MKKVFITVVGISILMGFVLWINQVQPLKADFKQSEEESKEEVINKDEFVNLELNNFFGTKDDVCHTNFKKYETLVRTTNNYLQRYVSMFLILSNLLDHEIKDVNEEITLDLEISVKGGDLAYLQKFSKSDDRADYLFNYSKLDKIFSKILRKKVESYREKALNSFWSLFVNFFFSVNKILGYYNVLLLLIILSVTWLIQKYCSCKCGFIYLVILINSVIIWESWNVYWKEIQEAEIEILVKKMELEVKKNCDFENMRWYDKIFYSRQQCVEYYKNLYKNPGDDVSLFNCIIKTYTFYFIQTPMKMVGASIRDFSEEISVSLPWPFNYFINVPLSAFLICIILCVILILCGKRLRLSFFGAAVEVGDVASNSEGISINYNAKTIHFLSKSRHLKRLKMDVPRWKKLFIKTSKSVPSVLNKNRLEFRNESAGHSEPESD